MIKAIAAGIFFVVFIFFSSFYPDWFHYIFYSGPTPGPTTNILLDVVAFLISLVVGVLSFFGLTKGKEFITKLLAYLQSVGDKNKPRDGTAF